MKPSTRSTASKKGRAAKKRSRGDRGVPFEEMRRLMRIYGPVKCCRKRQGGNAGGAEIPTKVDSVKRKFYRWFPDLEDRFVKDESGYFHPKFGHDFEMRYREGMRARDGEVLAKKRAMCRKERHTVATTGAKAKRVVTPSKQKMPSLPPLPPLEAACVTPVAAPKVPDGTLSAVPLLPYPERQDEDDIVEGDLNFAEHNPSALPSDVITADFEPMDRSFVAEEAIFDDVEKDFNTLSPGKDIAQECPPSISQTWSSSEDSSSTSSSGGSDSAACGSWDDSDVPSIDEVLDKSIEECCEDILGSDDNDSVGDYIFDMIQSS